MSLLAFLWAIFVQHVPSELSGNAWNIKAMEMTLSNLHAIQGFFGWVALFIIIICAVVILLSIIFDVKFFGAALSGCLLWVAVGALAIWLIGFLHILAVGFLIANFTLAGASNFGFWIVFFLLITGCWS
jgi:hypothetical protein